jgi:hypothetical protein
MIALIRRFHLLVLLGLAFIVPYATMGESTKSIRERIGMLWAAREAEPDPIDGIHDPVVNRLLSAQQNWALPEASGGGTHLTPTVSLQGILRFDATPRWILDSWPHVSTCRIDGPLDGLRVPVMTGTGPQAVVGSLTYYFDAQQQLQRIAMDGTMGDEREMVAMVTRLFELKPEPKAGVGIYVSRWNGKPISALWIRRMPVVHAHAGTQQYEFSLELNRPSNYHGLSARLQQRIQHAHASLTPGSDWR